MVFWNITNEQTNGLGDLGFYLSVIKYFRHLKNRLKTHKYYFDWWLSTLNSIVLLFTNKTLYYDKIINDRLLSFQYRGYASASRTQINPWFLQFSYANFNLRQPIHDVRVKPLIKIGWYAQAGLNLSCSQSFQLLFKWHIAYVIKWHIAYVIFSWHPRFQSVSGLHYHWAMSPH